MQDKKISRAQRRLEEGGQGAMAMDTAALRKNEEILALETQVRSKGSCLPCGVWRRRRRTPCGCWDVCRLTGILFSCIFSWVLATGGPSVDLLYVECFLMNCFGIAFSCSACIVLVAATVIIVAAECVEGGARRYDGCLVCVLSSNTRKGLLCRWSLGLWLDKEGSFTSSVYVL